MFIWNLYDWGQSFKRFYSFVTQVVWKYFEDEVKPIAWRWRIYTFSGFLSIKGGVSNAVCLYGHASEQLDWFNLKSEFKCSFVIGRCPMNANILAKRRGGSSQRGSQTQKYDFLESFSSYFDYIPKLRLQWPRGLKHEISSLALTLGSWVWIPLEA
jgi:hypothetical protein